MADGQGQLAGLLVAELGPPRGADIEGVHHPVAEGVDLGHADVQVEVAEGGGDGVEQPEASAALTSTTVEWTDSSGRTRTSGSTGETGR